MADIEWVFLTSAPNGPAAQALAGSLLAHGVATRIEAGSDLLGEVGPCGIFVGLAQVHRARWLLKLGEFSEAELDFLATGRLPGEDSG